MKRLLNGLSLIAAVAVVGLAISSCSSSDSDAEKGSAQGATTEQSTSSAEADAGDGGKSLIKDFGDHVPDQVGEWKSLDGFAGLAAWGRGGGRDAIIDATEELPDSAKNAADRSFGERMTRIDAGYCGVDENEMSRCFLAVEGGTSIGLSVVKGAELDDLVQFAEAFTDAVGIK